MKVCELIAELVKLPQDLDIIIQEDSEGNGYHKAYAVELVYDDEDHGYPSVSTKRLSDYYEDGEVPPEGKAVIIV